MNGLQLTKKNHFKFGYDQEYSPFRKSESQKWIVDYGSIERPVLDWKTECITTAQEIRQSTQKEIYVCLSGGIDSEITSEAFRLAQIPFTAAIMRFPNQLNQHDISWAEIYCDRYKIPIKYFEVDALKFYQTEYFNSIVESTHCFFPMLTLQMRLMKWVSDLNGFPVVGSAECYLELQPDQQWVMYEREIYASLYRFQIMNQIEGVSGFFQWNPENMYSFLIDPLVKNLVENKLPDVKSTLEIKHKIYTAHFNTLRRPKYFGWEGFSEEERLLRTKFNEKFFFARGEIKTPYNEVLKILTKNLNSPR